MVIILIRRLVILLLFSLFACFVKSLTMHIAPPSRLKYLTSRTFITRVKALAKDQNLASLPQLRGFDKVKQWVEENGGEVKVNVIDAFRNLVVTPEYRVDGGDLLLRIPRNLVLGLPVDDTERNITDSAFQKFLSTIKPSNWRTRIALNLINFTSITSSHLDPITRVIFGRELPSGLPMFFPVQTARLLNGLPIMKELLQQCAFASALHNIIASKVGKLLYPTRSSLGVKELAVPFAFASLCSVRKESLEKPLRSSELSSFVPIINLLPQSLTPNCDIRVSFDDNSYEIYARRKIYPTEPLSIRYPALSNDEMFADYGVSLENNVYDTVPLSLDATAINSARAVAGQIAPDDYADSIYCRSRTTHIDDNLDSKVKLIGKKTSNNSFLKLLFGFSNEKNFSLVPVGKDDSLRFFDESLGLERWQRNWLDILNITGLSKIAEETIGYFDGNRLESANFRVSTLLSDSAFQSMTISSSRLWALLRIWYTQNEHDVLSHGFDPFTLQHPAALLSPNIESRVVCTIAGMIAMQISQFSDHIDAECAAWASGTAEGLRYHNERFLNPTVIATDCSDAMVYTSRRHLLALVDYYESMKIGKDNPFDPASSDQELQAIHKIMSWSKSAVIKPSSSWDDKKLSVLTYRILKKQTLMVLLFVCFRLLEDQHGDEHSEHVANVITDKAHTINERAMNLELDVEQALSEKMRIIQDQWVQSKFL